MDSEFEKEHIKTVVTQRKQPQAGYTFWSQVTDITTVDIIE